jgi:hypothetical protein
VCVLDVDRDGELDLFFAQPVDDGAPGGLLQRGLGGLRFADETRARGLEGQTGGGCLGFDLEGDGDTDLLVLGPGRVRLLRNDAGMFHEASTLLPAIDPSFLYTSAVAFDADGDGDLDLAFGAYGRYEAPSSTDECVVRCDLNNSYYRRGTPTLLLQRSDGTFEDASARIGLHLDERELVLLATDLDENGRIDLFVGIDDFGARDHYFASDGAGGWVDVAATLGVAANARNNGISSMSATDPDLDVDGHLDLVESSWEDDPDSFFRCLGAAGCKEIGDEVELYRTPRNLRWGQATVDFDDDGVPEILEAVGHFYRKEDLLDPASDGGIKDFAPIQAPLLLWHRERESAPFSLETTDRVLARETGGRGVVAVDLDHDGALDAVVAPAVGPALILRGVHGPRGHWLGVSLAGKGKNSRAIGARVTVRASGRTYVSLVHAGSGYRSSVDAPLHFGVGDAAKIDGLDVAWPSGAHTHLDSAEIDRVVEVREP